MTDLRLNDVVANARLDLWTCKYVLKHPEVLRGMPQAGSQGRHRIFTLDQATRLAFCTLIVSAGFPLKIAGTVVRHSEKLATDIGGAWQPGTARYGGRSSIYAPFRLRIINSKFLKLVRDKIERPKADDGWLLIGTRFLVQDEEIDGPLTTYELSLTMLEALLQRAS